jgi:phthiocerol/phenolphthiocerol synthesis type-I polyketide synthase B
MTSLAERAVQLSPQAREALARELIRAGTRFPADAVAEPVAVVGMGCRFPGGVTGPSSYWRLLLDGGDAVTEVPADRWDADEFYDPDSSVPGRMTTKWGGFVSDAEGFDAEFFGITPREGEAMDPQQRMLLEVAWEALEHAGIPPDSLGGSRTGVIIGLASWDYTLVNMERRAEIDAYVSTGNPHSTAVGRIAYVLGLRGPAVAVDTACSSSLVAVHLACQSLRLRESDLALAGGVQLSLSPFAAIALSKWSALSPQGRCQAFDAGADGTVRGEGCGVVVLKRLADAVRDGDRVLAVVRGSAVNQDGRSNGLTAPNVLAQRDLITDALRAADVPPDTVNYVEAHGTGTVLGDPIEFEALAATYGSGDVPCALGSVKTNFGHLEAAAGVAGFIKAVLAVGHDTIPPNLHFTRWNRAIDPAPTRFFVPTETSPWPPSAGPRRAGVSSFGLAGTNAHVVVEQAPNGVVPVVDSVGPAVSTLVVSGKTVARVRSWAAVLADWMDGAGAGVETAAVAHTLNHHRARHPRFATVCAADRAQAIAGLRAVAAGIPAPGVVLAHDEGCGQGTVFVYSGQGSQWAGMGRQLLAEEPAFADAIASLEPDFVAQTGFSLRAVLAGGEPVSGIDRIQPVLVGIQLALTALWTHYGVTPDAVIGHSLGEIAAAVTAGILTPADALAVAACRSRLLATLSGRGAMAMLELDADATEAVLGGYPEVSVAVYASPRQTVIAGPPAAVDAVTAAVSADHRLARRIDVDVAGHHEIVDTILPQLRAALAGLAPQPARLRMISTTHPGADSTCDADYWAANLRNPVRFAQAVAQAGATHTTFVEISPHPLLTSAIDDTLADTHHHALATLARNTHDTISFHTALNATHTTHPPDTEHPPGPHPQLPTTPWQHTRHWTTTAANAAESVHNGRGETVTADGGAGRDWWYVPRWTPRAASDTQDAPSGRWLVFADAQFGVEVSRGAGAPVTIYPPQILDTDLDVQWVADLAGVQNVLYAPTVSAEPIDVAAGYRLFHAAKRLTAAMISGSSPARLFILTRNAQPVTDGDQANPAHALLWGLGRTVALEHPEIWGGIIDLDESVPPVLAAPRILAEATSSDGEDQIVYRGAVRHVPRLQRQTPTPRPGMVLDPDGSHLVIGASGKIGPHLIEQLARMGARTIVAVSRRGGRLDGCRQRLSACGATLIDVAADAADPAAMTALFDRFGTDLPALHGIYLAAYAGGPVTLADMTDTDISAMLRPKLDAALLLHTLSLRTPLRHFVMFSSISGLLGSRWLAHYTATSTFLDTLAHTRRNMGLPATTINWGLWKSLSDNESQARQVTSEIGLVAMPDELAVEALAAAMSPDAPVAWAVVDADWTQLAAAYRTRAALHIVDDLLTEQPHTPTARDGQFRHQLQECPPERRHQLLADHVATLAATVMGLTPTELDPTTGFFQLGMDSLMSLTLQRQLTASLGEPLSPAVIFDYPTVDALTAHLATLLPELADTTERPHRADVDPYAQATEDELLQQLSEKLGTS